MENKNLLGPIKKVATSEFTNTTENDFCVEVTIKWNTYESYCDEEYGMEGVAITPHAFSLTFCL